MTSLSPQAQAVLDAVEDDCIHPTDLHHIAAAALRAAADEVVPSNALYARSCCEFVGEQCRAQLLAIADELEAQ